MDLTQFLYTEASSITDLLNKREGESKLGERVRYGEDYASDTTQFVVLGIAESIGVKGNLGIAGAHTAWQVFLKSFLNIQNTKALKAESIHLLGHFNFQVLYDSCNTTEDYRKATEFVDDAVYPIIKEIVSHGKIPIIIGGSHANAYPIIKGCSLAHKTGIAAINLDAHADFRQLEGRHSGNPFSYSHHEGLLEAYGVIGLHENYNSQAMLDEMDSKQIHYTTWEDIYLRKKVRFAQVIESYVAQFAGYPCGIELDLDAISQVLSSAMSSGGFSVTEARQYAYKAAKHPKAAYLHLCEASAKLENGLESQTTGKLLSYLATDFIKSYQEA
jgi:formiminoglutamase